MNHPLRCRCGTLQGYILPSTTAARAVCYCKDCQAYARFLGVAGVTDHAGGTEVIAMLPRYVHFTAGLDALACLSLSEHGLLRWYAGCCRTPIGNTPRDRKLPYAGMVHSCLEGSTPIESSFGQSRIAVNTRSAHGAVASTPMASTLAMLRLMTSSLGTRLSRRYRDNPFFAPDTGTPIRPVYILSSAERARAYGEAR